MGRFGNAFIEGDPTSIIALQSITIALQQSLLEKLRNAAFDDDTRITDFTYLVDAADLGRDRTIATLHELKSRLLNAELALNEGEVGVDTLQSSTPPVTSPPLPSTPAPTYELPTRSRTNSSLSAPRTWTRDYNHSRDASGEEDATSGAEADNPRTRQRKRSSLLSFLKPHNRTASWNEKELAPHMAPPAPQQPQIPEESSASSRASQSLEQRRQPSNTPTNTLANAVVYRPPPPPSQPSSDLSFTYEEWEDNPQEIWGPATATTTKTTDRRDTINVAPDSPPSPVMAYRTNSGNASSHSHSTNIQTPNPSNDYLGFCKSAYRLQNADRKALTKTREVEPWSRHPTSSANAMHFLSCVTKNCAFRSTFTHRDTEMIWNRLLPERKGVRARWRFLAKSHVPLRRAGTQASFECLFCVFLHGKSSVYHGPDLYLDHIADEHRGAVLGDVVLYKTGCVNDQICEDSDLTWDINLAPGTYSSPKSGIAASTGMSSNLSDHSMPFNPEDYTTAGWRARMEDNRYDSVLGANEPWNEGLSDFHYRGELDRTELE